MSFHFSHGDRFYRCNLTCNRCTGITKTGGQCKKITCKYLPLCFIHLKQKGFQVKQSTIPNTGDGLFTLIARAKHEVIGEYIGEVLTDQQTQDRYGDVTAPFAVQGKKNHNIDPACKRGYTAYVNSAYHTLNKINNCEFVASHRGGTRVSIRTTRAIQAGAELFVAYGASYWGGLDGTYVTKKRKL